MSTNSYSDFFFKNHLQERTIEKKLEYIQDLHSAVSRCISGRVGVGVSFNFMVESEHMVSNAISQYEQGFFDAAFYSLRAVLDIFMVLVFMIEHDEIELKSALDKWNAYERMLPYSRMENYLTQNSEIFSDVKECMNEYFEELRELSKKLNKKVHKQNFVNFYANRVHPLQKEKYDFDGEQEFFEYAVKRVIGAVIVFRLVIDPIPVLLMDEEIYLRTNDMMSGPLWDDFIENYIGYEHIEYYKQCQMYELHHQSYMQEEKQFASVSNIIKSKHIDLDKIEEIYSQFHLLYKSDQIVVKVCEKSSNIYAIDMFNGFRKYTTSNIPKEKTPYYRNMDHSRFRTLEEDVYNIEHKDIVISVFKVNGGNVFIEASEEVDLSILCEISALWKELGESDL